MGKAANIQPKGLPSKLLAVRTFLGFTQEEMVRHIQPYKGDTGKTRAALSDYESGRRTPSLLEIFYYAKTVRDLTVYKNLPTDDLIDDSCELPFTISGKDSASINQFNVLSLNAPFADKSALNDSPAIISTLPAIQSDENRLSDTSIQKTDEHEVVEIDYRRSFFFSGEFVETFDNFAMRLLLTVPYDLRETYCDSAVSIEIAVAAALRDLERMERKNTPSVVVECLHEHINNHYEN